MSQILIIYQSKYGQTKKIVSRIQKEVQKFEDVASVFNVTEIPKALNLKHYDAVIIGAPVYAGGFSKDLKHWVRAHAEILNRMPSAFFSVCLGILQNDEHVQTDEKKIVTDFFDSTKWAPKMWDIFAGALAYSKYNWFLKIIMKRIASKAGGSTNTSKDYEYTDWNKILKFTDDFLESLRK